MTFVVFGLAWLTFNLIFAALCAFLASRWGRDPFGWLLMGTVLGPFAFVTLLALRRDDRGRGRSLITGPLTRAAVPGIKVLVPADGSAPSQRAAEWVIDHLTAPTGEVTVLTVLPLERADAAALTAESPRRQMLESEIRANTESAYEALELAGLGCRTVTRFGDPGDEIIALADEGNYDLIVLGRKGRGAVAKLLLGSVSEKVIKGARQPVMVVD